MGLWGCGDEVRDRVESVRAPTYQMEVPDAAVPLGPAPQLLVTPEARDWGGIITHTFWWHAFTVANLGDEPLLFEDLQIEGHEAFEIRIDDIPLVDQPDRLADPDLDGLPGLSPGARFELRVYFTPIRDGVHEANLVMTTNDARLPRREVSLIGEGVAPPPCDPISPLVLDFPEVAAGTEVEAILNVRNCTQGPIEILDVLVEGSPFFALDSGLTLPRRIPSPVDLFDQPGIGLPVRYAPEEVQRHTAQLTVLTDDPDLPARSVRLQGTGGPNLCPTPAVAEAVVQVPVGEPAILDSSPSTDPEDGALDSFWTVVDRPEGSQSGVREAWRPGLGVIDDSEITARAVFIPDVPGRYVIELNIIDAFGNDASMCGQVARMEVVALPRARGLTTVLTWTSPEDPVPGDGQGPDLDLHLRRAGETAWFDETADCFFGSLSPDWGPPGFDGDPFVSVAGQNEGGPEIIALPEPEPTVNGAYRVGVHMFRRTLAGQDLGPAVARVQVYDATGLVFDTDVAGISRLIRGVNHFFEVVDLTWPGPGIQVVNRYFEERP